MNNVTNVRLSAETIEEEMILRKAIGFVPLAKTSTSLGEQNATAVERVKMAMLRDTSHRSEITIVRTIVETVQGKKTMVVTIGSALPVTTLTSPSERNAINVANQKQEVEVVKDNLVEDFQTVVNEADVDQIAVEEAEMVVETSVETEADVIQIAVEEAEMVVEVSVETEADVIQIAVEEAEMVVETSVETEATETNEGIQDEAVTMKVQMNATEKRVENAQVMLTIEGLNPFVLDAIKAEIETIEVNPRGSRSALLGCSGSTRSR